MLPSLGWPTLALCSDHSVKAAPNLTLAFCVPAMYHLSLILHFRGRHQNCHPKIKLQSPSYTTAADCLTFHDYKKMYPNTFCSMNFFAHSICSFEIAVNRDSPPCPLIPHLDLISVQGLGLSYGGNTFSWFSNLHSSKPLEICTSTVCISALLCSSTLLKRAERQGRGAKVLPIPSSGATPLLGREGI